jgi:hypothetical protein
MLKLSWRCKGAGIGRRNLGCGDSAMDVETEETLENEGYATHTLTCFLQAVGHRRDTAFKDAHSSKLSLDSVWTRRCVFMGINAAVYHR